MFTFTFLFCLGVGYVGYVLCGLRTDFVAVRAKQKSNQTQSIFSEIVGLNLYSRKVWESRVDSLVGGLPSDQRE